MAFNSQQYCHIVNLCVIVVFIASQEEDLTKTRRIEGTVFFRRQVDLDGSRSLSLKWVCSADPLVPQPSPSVFPGPACTSHSFKIAFPPSFIFQQRNSKQTFLSERSKKQSYIAKLHFHRTETFTACNCFHCSMNSSSALGCFQGPRASHASSDPWDKRETAWNALLVGVPCVFEI